MKRIWVMWAIVAGAAAGNGLPARAGDGAVEVTMTIDAGKAMGPLRPIWKYCGYDEPNYTYTEQGKKLIAQLAEAGKGFGAAYFRTHNLLCTGDGAAAVRWGSTNAYTEDMGGKAVYDWGIMDRIFDTYANAGARPFAQIGFMPKALSRFPEPYQHSWAPGDATSKLYTGWTSPPTDYDKWRELVFQWGKHAAERYGAEQVKRWQWEVWNEPNNGYLKGTVEDYERIYDYATEGLRRALPEARVGGAETAGPGGAFQRAFIEHCVNGTNYATGKKGSPLDLISFHAKGSPTFVMEPERHVRMGISNQLKNVDEGFALVAERAETRKLPIIIGESDPDGCAACPGAGALYPQYGYRNGTLYAVYTVEQLSRTLELADRRGVTIEGAVTWAFEFENQPMFGGFRQLSTNGVALPVLNVFRMLGRMGHEQLSVKSSGDVGLDAIVRDGVRGEKPDEYALASRNDGRVTIVAWNYHDDDLPGAAANVTIDLRGLPGTVHAARVAEWRIDETHSNAYTAWKQMGSPEKPSAEQMAALEKASELTEMGPADGAHATGSGGREVAMEGGGLAIKLELPRQAVSLVEVTWQP